ncbi:MAG: shikimate dehydrogenase [Candidatus Nitricoxidivorans perseverans]|uniref:Shikimate dehydrogenase (NADP(+)) n=1 Tax=Candidatus Nitricoxidivorans perseverans TaxID=2975601 RepID=A0AA49ITW5_9PROT|nr:MAG: shikimate dehydrogenase [Candidatus Nitricoxidivorans perseverans]
MTDKYAVVGNPVAHSKSPRIHALFAAQTGQDMAYGAILAPLDGFAATVRAFIDESGRGMNVTVPFKEEAHRLATRRTPRAEAAGAVNTLMFDGAEILGDNTDGAGLVRDIATNLGAGIAGRRILLLGAGGAARGVILPLMGEQPAELFVANRTAEKAARLAAAFGIHGGGFEALAGKSFDLVINATSAGLSDAVLPLPASVFASGCLAYEMVYGRETPFMAGARAAGARVADGLGMLVEQAAESFFVWRGARPDTAPVLAALRK